MIAEFDVDVSYGQVGVYVSNIKPPPFQWTDEHNAQGFAWMPTIVSFPVPDHDGICLIQVDVVSRPEVEAEALWAVRVPFDVPSVPLTIGSIFEGQNVDVPEGKYSLIFEALPGSFVDAQDFAYVLRFKFFEDQNPDFEILKKGGEVTVDKVLRKGDDRTIR